MTKPTYPIGSFTPEAAQRWERISQCLQERILANVWCGRCLGAVSIILDTAEMMEDALVLQGKCRDCGGNVYRGVEPEPD